MTSCHVKSRLGRAGERMPEGKKEEREGEGVEKRRVCTVNI